MDKGIWYYPDMVFSRIVAGGEICAARAGLDSAWQSLAKLFYSAAVLVDDVLPGSL